MQPIRASNRLLDRFPIIRSANVAEIEHAILRTYGARRFNVVGKSSALNVQANYWRGSSIALSLGHNNGADTEVNYSGVCYFRQHFAIAGSTKLRIDRREHELSPTAPCMVPAGQPLYLRTPSGFENLVFRIDRGFLAGKAAAMTGECEPRFHSDPELQSCFAGAARLERLIRFLVAELGPNDTPPIFVSEMEQTLAVAFILANPQLVQNARPCRPAATARHQLRLAEEYIEAHWDKPLALETLAEATNVSARSLFYYFHKWRGKTPMQYLKEVRLNHARQLLQQSPDMTVTAVAFACGFGNLGHFARDYHKAWGERPSETQRGYGYKN